MNHMSTDYTDMDCKDTNYINTDYTYTDYTDMKDGNTDYTDYLGSRI